jgi:hypothetical protein
LSYESWRNKLSEGFSFSLNNIDYYVQPFGIVLIPEEFHNIPAHRGLALEFIPDGSEQLQIDCTEQETTTEAIVEIAKTMLRKPKPKKKTNGVN